MARRFPTRIFHGVFVLAAALASVTALAPASHADDVITGSLGLAPGGVAAISGAGFAEAQAFQTDDNRYELTSVIARVGNQTGTPLVIANLRADAPSGMIPTTGAASYLTSFAPPDLTGVISDRAFVPNSTVILEANTRYWFVLGTESDDSQIFSWAFSAVNGPITGPGAVPPQFAETADGGDTWEVSRGAPFFIEVRGIRIAAAPEPSVFGLFAFGLFASGLLSVTRRNAVSDDRVKIT